MPPPLPSATGDAVWRLRAGLNVAALTCRGGGRSAVAPGYRAVLARHADLLARSHAEEQRRHGVAGFDHQQTRLYNRFALQRSPAKFCRSAQSIADEAARMPSPELASQARQLVGQLEAALN